MRLLAILGILVVAAGMAAGCSSPPPFNFYTLSAVAGPSGAPSTWVVALGPVTIPGMVDRPEIVVSTGPNAVKLDDFNRWASPLQDNLSHALAEDLSILLGTPQVVINTLPLAAEADLRVAVDVRSFDSTLGDSAALDAVWTIRRVKDKKTLSGHSSVREGVVGGGYPALAGAHSRALAKMSREIADAIIALQRDPA